MLYNTVACNLCGSDRAKAMGKRMSPDRNARLETNIVRCASCGFIYPNPMPQLTDAEIQDSFKGPEEYFSASPERRLSGFENILNEIEKERPQKGRILDIGCARGELLHAAERRNWEAVGTDISEAFVRYAREKFGVNAMAGDLRDLDLSPGSFDAACLISVIQYLQNPMETLKRINALLKPGGLLYIEVTNEDALVFKAGDLFKSATALERITTRLSPLFPSFQVYGFNKNSLRKALEASGFDISYLKTGGKGRGGNLKGAGAANKLLNFFRRIAISIGDLTGNGHLIFCMARKRG